MFRHIRSKLIAAFAVPLAILVAVAIPAWQRRQARRDAEGDLRRRDKEFIRRLVSGIRAEINQALAAAARRQIAIEETLKAAEQYSPNAGSL